MKLLFSLESRLETILPGFPQKTQHASVFLGNKEKNKMKTNLMNDPATLRAALVGYQVELSRLNAEKAKLESQLAGDQPAERKRNLSAAARKRISAAQRKRWAAYRENKKG